MAEQNQKLYAQLARILREFNVYIARDETAMDVVSRMLVRAQRHLDDNARTLWDALSQWDGRNGTVSNSGASQPSGNGQNRGTPLRQQNGRSRGTPQNDQNRGTPRRIQNARIVPLPVANQFHPLLITHGGDLGGRSRRATTGLGPETDNRLDILNSLLTCPHRDVAPLIPLFQQVHDKDPLFFGHLAAWYVGIGTIHDLKQLFIAMLITSKFSQEYRQAGLAMIDSLAPFHLERVVKMIKGGKRRGIYHKGIVGNVPRSLRTEIIRYLRKRESDIDSFAAASLFARKSLKYLYSSLRIKPGPLAQDVLFRNAPPESMRNSALKLLAHESNPVRQAEIILHHKIPYRIAVGAVREMTPEIVHALVSVMTPQEVINNMASLKRRQMCDSPQIYPIIKEKLEQGGHDPRVSMLKTRVALKAAAGLEETLAQSILRIGDKKAKNAGKITRSTALLVDKSASMHTAVQIGTQVASLIAPLCQAPLYVYAFDTAAVEIKAQGKELSDWERAFSYIKADGSTSCGIAIEEMMRRAQWVDQIVIITDQDENTKPFFVPQLQEYQRRHPQHVTPHIVIVHVSGMQRKLEQQLRNAAANGITYDTYVFSGDYYSLPNLIPLLCRGTRLDLLMDIMETPLPTRQRHPSKLAC
ncbi:MAG TPA: hypothetical protein V6D17_09105 [Candidatus Obscuribacterales bacterium]